MEDQRARLVWRRPDGRVEEFALASSETILGRDPSCHLPLPSAFVSRRHARVLSRGGRHLVQDLGSKNGTRVNGAPCSGPCPLADGDVLELGDCWLQFRDGRSGGTATLSLPLPRSSPDATQELRVDPAQREIWVGPHRLVDRLSRQEFALLDYLYRHRDRVCPREEIGDAIWGTGNYDTNMVHRLVMRVRRKVEPHPPQPRYVQAVPGFGYRLVTRPAEEG